MQPTREERLASIKLLVKLYENELKDVLQISTRFELDRLPPIIQEATKFATAKSPTFSNVSAVTTVNAVFMHLLGQLRPKINDIVYSPDLLGINYMAINISGSGAGKDNTYRSVHDACSTAFKLIEDEKTRLETKKAIARALREMRKDNPNATESDVTYDDYIQYVKPNPELIAESSSTRGGLVSNLTDHQNRSLGVSLVTMGEFGRALKANGTVQEILELLGVLYDQGKAAVQMFKTVEVREQPLVNVYPNALLHSSPRIIFGDEAVKSNISMLFSTMLARRTWFTMPTEEEAVENNPVPTTLAEARKLADDRGLTISNISVKLDNITADIVRTMLISEEKRIVRFDEEAKVLYTDYFGYCAKKAELLEDGSILQIELNGRSFKLGRLAALWALMSNTNVITHKILASAIYFAEYNTRYLEAFMHKTSSKSYILLGDIFKNGKAKSIQLDEALNMGYISRITTDFKELLEPLNSYMRHIGVVTYDSTNKIFVYTPFKKVEETGDYGMSYTKVDGIVKLARSAYLSNFENYKTGSLKLVENIMTKDTIYNTFRFNDEDGVKMKRNKTSITGNTKLVILDVDTSSVDIYKMHEYLNEFKHVITTTSDVNNTRKFRIAIPINIEISSDPQQYKCIIKALCEQLIVTADPASFVATQAMYGYAGALSLVNDTGELFDIADILTDCATYKEDGLVIEDKPKTPAAMKKQVDDMMANATRVFDYVINCPKGTGSLSLARASLHMSDAGFTKDQYTQVIHYLNSCWQVPMESSRLENTIINQFIGKMK